MSSKDFNFKNNPLPQKGELVRIKSYYYVDNICDDHFKLGLKNKIAMVLSVEQVSKLSKFGPHFFVKMFCEGYFVDAWIEDIEIIK